MLSRARLFLFLGLCGVAAAQSPAPRTDIDPNSLSRFPIVPRSEMKTDADRAAYDYVVGTTPRTTPLLGPGGLSLHSPGSAEAIERLNRYLRNDSVIGRRLFELCALIGAWEIEQQYEWSGHEPAALQFGVSQRAVDTVKFNRPIEGLPEDEAVVIQMGRQILRDHRLDDELYARAVKLFGRQGTLELSISMGDYVMAGIMLITANHQLPPNRPALLPAR
jgi:4-carboxymuconolactone decarboxylase